MHDAIQSRYFIPEQSLASFKAKIDHLAKRAKKLGFPSITWRDLGTSSRVLEKHIVDMEFKQSRIENVLTIVHEIEVSGERPILRGWNFLGVIEHEGSESLVKSMNGSIPKEYWNCSPKCDHCQTQRLRNQTYILQNLESGEFKQVGKSCLQDFFGNDDPRDVAAYSQLLFEVHGYFSDLEGGDELSFGGAPGFFGVQRVLEAACASVREDGFISRHKADDLVCMSTGDVVGGMLYGGLAQNAPKISQEDKLKAQAIQSWLISEEFATQAEKSAYLHNLLALARLDAVSRKNTPIMASAVVVYDRYLEQGELKKGSMTVSGHVGGVGAKLEHHPVRLLSRAVIPGGLYGDKILYRFQDSAGHRLVWFCSGQGLRIDTGEQVLLSGTIKAHTEYKGTKQTDLLRVKVTEELLLSAIEGGDTEFDKKTKKLLEMGDINLDVRFTRDRETLLMCAAYLGKASMVSDLLRVGADPLLQDCSGYTAAHRCAYRDGGTYEILECASPESVQLPDEGGKTAQDHREEHLREEMASPS